MHQGSWRSKYSLLQPIERQEKKLYVHPYEKLGGGSKGFYIKGYEVNWDYKLGVSFNALKCRDIIQYDNGQTMNNGKIRIRYVSNIISITPFINATTEVSHIESINKISR